MSNVRQLSHEYVCIVLENGARYKRRDSGCLIEYVRYVHPFKIHDRGRQSWFFEGVLTPATRAMTLPSRKALQCCLYADHNGEN